MQAGWNLGLGLQAELGNLMLRWHRRPIKIMGGGGISQESGPRIVNLCRVAGKLPLTQAHPRPALAGSHPNHSLLGFRTNPKFHPARALPSDIRRLL